MAENPQIRRVEKLPLQYQQIRAVLLGYRHDLLNSANHRDERICLAGLCQILLDIVRILPVLCDYRDLQFLFSLVVIFKWLLGSASGRTGFCIFIHVRSRINLFLLSTLFRHLSIDQLQSGFVLSRLSRGSVVENEGMRRFNGTNGMNVETFSPVMLTVTVRQVLISQPPGV